MITMLEAKAIINEHLPGPQIALLSLNKCPGRTLAADITATHPSPACNNSAMDGFAIRFNDIQPDAFFKIIGESRAGIPFDGEVVAGTAVRINTGALVPTGADTVVPVEDCKETSGSIRLTAPVKAGQHIRKKGEEFQTGDLLLRTGTVIRPPQMALLAFLGISDVEVYKPPRVSICVTGSELRHVKDSVEDFQVRDSNSPMLASAVSAAGGEVVSVSRVGDDFDDTVSALGQSAETSDLVLVTGGVSVGPHDHVKEAASHNGFSEKFRNVRQKPGKPFFFAVRENKLLFGLPGNPVSAFMNYIVYVDPLIRRLVSPTWQPKRIIARPEAPIANNGGRTQLYRASLDDSHTPPIVRLTVHQGSHMISSLTAADGYLVVEPGENFTENDDIIFHPFPWS
ncbi:MAG: molybdopterin molybdotransferase MoeA [Calditrichaeota bacterium]|nr:molybdopterin molybdotransferase MoeA [Calditrichota bacterium]